MSRFHRKTAPKVRHGRVRQQNNWKQSPSLYIDPQPRLVIDRRPPGAGHRHLLLKRDVERFVRLIPNWDDVSAGLEVIVLDRARRDCDGWHDRGVIGICAWPTEMSSEADPDWYRGHRAFLERIAGRVEGDGPEVTIHWTPGTARAYQLCHVFLHELGHHRDRMTTRSCRCSRGEGYAENYAWEFEPRVLERYFEEFGLPD